MSELSLPADQLVPAVDPSSARDKKLSLLANQMLAAMGHASKGDQSESIPLKNEDQSDVPVHDDKSLVSLADEMKEAMIREQKKEVMTPADFIADAKKANKTLPPHVPWMKMFIFSHLK